jgi:hypothetical protein
MASAQQPNQQVQPPLEPQHCDCEFCSRHQLSITPQSCLALRKFIKSVVFSPNGKADKAVYEDARQLLMSGVVSSESLRSLAIANRRNQEASEQHKRQELFMQQQKNSSRIGGALISSFPIKPLQHISSYLHAPSRALFAVALGNFDMSSISGKDFAPTKELSTVSVIKRRKISEGLPLPQRKIGLDDVPTEALQHVASFLAAPSQVMFGLHVAAAEDKSLNKRSFAIAEEQSWDTLDFGEIEKDVASRLTDDDIKAVLWCIDAGNKVKRLRLTNCVNITGSCLEPLSGSEVIEQIDMSLVGDHEEPIPLETWHPPLNEEVGWSPLCYFDWSSSACIPIYSRLSCEHVLPVLDSIISREKCSLKHLHFPKGVHSKTSWEGYQKMTDSIYHEWLPRPLFADFLTRYTEYMMNRGIRCTQCSQNLPSNGCQWFGNDLELGFNFFNQNHTCSKCLNNYCYRHNDRYAGRPLPDYARKYNCGDRVLERCRKCEREYCVECSDMYYCEWCNKYFCEDCRGSVGCSHNSCGNKCCSDCDLKFCRGCEKKYCSSCCQHCESCDEWICHDCDEFECCSAEDCESSMCAKCASDGCQKCKRAFCGCEYTNRCQYCEQDFCRDCDTFRECEGRDCWGRRQCSGCDEKVPKGLADHDFVRRCESCERDLCGSCRLDPSRQFNPMNCDGCTRLINEMQQQQRQTEQAFFGAVRSAIHDPNGEVDQMALQRALAHGLSKQAILNTARMARKWHREDREQREQQQQP